MKKTTLVVFAMLCILASVNAQVHAPTVEWKQVTYDHDDINENPITQAQSGSEWWYSHKKLVDASNNQIGYIAVG